MPKVVNHEERRQALAAAAATLIANRGVASATVRNVARAAAVSTGTVSHYYGDSRELLFAAYQLSFKTSSERFVQAMQRDDSLDGLTAALITALPLTAAGLAEWRVRMAFWGVSDFADNIRAFEQSSSEQFRKLIAQRLKALQYAGAVRLRSTAADVARSIEGLLIGTAMQHLLSPGSERPAAMRKRLREQLRNGVLEQ